MIVSYSGNANRGDFNKLHNLLQNLHPEIKFTMEQSKRTTIFRHPHKKTKMTELSKISITNPQTPNNTFTLTATIPKIV